jgi:hypothetical protein
MDLPGGCDGRPWTRLLWRWTRTSSTGHEQMEFMGPSRNNNKINILAYNYRRCQLARVDVTHRSREWSRTGGLREMPPPEFGNSINNFGGMRRYTPPLPTRCILFPWSVGLIRRIHLKFVFPSRYFPFSFSLFSVHLI